MSNNTRDLKKQGTILEEPINGESSNVESSLVDSEPDIKLKLDENKTEMTNQMQASAENVDHTGTFLEVHLISNPIVRPEDGYDISCQIEQGNTDVITGISELACEATVGVNDGQQVIVTESDEVISSLPATKDYESSSLPKLCRAHHGNESMLDSESNLSVDKCREKSDDINCQTLSCGPTVPQNSDAVDSDLSSGCPDLSLKLDKQNIRSSHSSILIDQSSATEEDSLPHDLKYADVNDSIPEITERHDEENKPTPEGTDHHVDTEPHIVKSFNNEQMDVECVKEDEGENEELGQSDASKADQDRDNLLTSNTVCDARRHRQEDGSDLQMCVDEMDQSNVSSDLPSNAADIPTLQSRSKSEENDQLHSTVTDSGTDISSGDDMEERKKIKLEQSDFAD